MQLVTVSASDLEPLSASVYYLNVYPLIQVCSVNLFACVCFYVIITTLGRAASRQLCPSFRLLNHEAKQWRC